MGNNTRSVSILSSSDRGQSNALFLIIFFAIVFLTSIAGALAGFSILEDAGSGKADAAAKSGMLQLRGNMYDLASGSPFRTTDIEIQQGSITYGEPIEIRISASSAEASMAAKTIRPQPIIYALGETNYIFVGGAVILEQEAGAVMKEGPSFKIDSRQAIIPLINTTHHGGPPRLAVDGGGKVSVNGHMWSKSSTQFEPTLDGEPADATVTMTVKSPRYEMWSDWFQDRPRFSNVVVDESTNTVSAQFTTKRLYVQTVITRVKLEP
jgi:hypothetical protein